MPSGRDQWVAMAKAIYSRFGEVQVTDRAAALTYYAILSLFPALIVVVSALALVGEYPGTYQSIVDTLRDAAPGPAVDAIDSALRSSLSDRGNAGVAFLAVVVAGPLFGSIADAAGFSGLLASLVGYLRWPIGAGALLTAFAVVDAEKERAGGEGS